MPWCSQAREEFGGEEGAEAGPVDDAVAEEQAERKFPWSGEDRDYNYEELLGGWYGSAGAPRKLKQLLGLLLYHDCLVHEA